LRPTNTNGRQKGVADTSQRSFSAIWRRKHRAMRRPWHYGVAIHKRLWEELRNNDDLEEAVRAYARGYYIRNDYNNGINYAFMLNVSRGLYRRAMKRLRIAFLRGGYVNRFW